MNFYLPGPSQHLLQRIPGFEGFNPSTEILHNDKPGTGLVDAPRAFSYKLAQVTSRECDLQPTTVDAELVVKHDNGNLVAIMSKHVDDLKIAARKEVILWILGVLEKTFGKLTVSWNSFTNCGIRHIQCKTTKEIKMDQIEYLAALKPIKLENVRTLDSDAEVTESVLLLFMSLLGALAYGILTRLDVAVLVVALQRAAHKCKYIHVKRLNTLVRWVQQHPLTLTYQRLNTDGRAAETHLRCLSDAAFRNEGDTGHALKGAAFMRIAAAPGHYGSAK